MWNGQSLLEASQMSEAGNALLRELHSLVLSDAHTLLQAIQQGGKPLAGLTDDELTDLRSIHLTQAQTTALEKALVALGRGVIFGLLCIIDGVSYTHESIPDLALVSRETRQDISDGLLHDEFYDMLPG